MRFHEITVAGERGRKSANLSIGETTKPRRSGRQFASEAGDRGRSVRALEADDARPESRLAGQHGSVPSLAGKKTKSRQRVNMEGDSLQACCGITSMLSIETEFSLAAKSHSKNP